MKHLLLSYLLLFAAPSITHAQKHVCNDLLVLYVDEAYEKCIAKAERYTDQDDTRRDPLPYLYQSMCYHEMSTLEKYTDRHEYRCAHRNALKYAALYRKKDKKNEHVQQFQDYWQELNAYAMGIGVMHYEMGDFSKARRIFDRMVVYMPENAGASRMRALCQERMNLKRDSSESRTMFDQAYAPISDPAELPTDQRRLLRQALILEAEHLLANGRNAEAKELMALGEDRFMGNAEFKALFEEVN